MNPADLAPWLSAHTILLALVIVRALFARMTGG